MNRTDVPVPLEGGGVQLDGVRGTSRDTVRLARIQLRKPRMMNYYMVTGKN